MFELHYEVEIGDFLGIYIEKTWLNLLPLSQSRLIDELIKTSNMETDRSTTIPSSTI